MSAYSTRGETGKSNERETIFHYFFIANLKIGAVHISQCFNREAASLTVEEVLHRYGAPTETSEVMNGEICWFKNLVLGRFEAPEALVYQFCLCYDHAGKSKRLFVESDYNRALQMIRTKMSAHCFPFASQMRKDAQVTRVGPFDFSEHDKTSLILMKVVEAAP